MATITITPTVTHDPDDLGWPAGWDDQLKMVATFHGAFGVPTRMTPALPPLLEATRSIVGSVALNLGAMAVMLKAMAARANEAGLTDDGAALVRLQLHVEETGELAEALEKSSLPGLLDALSDIGFVNAGTYLVYGLQWVKALADREVFSSNMSKLGPDGKPIIHESGRVMKGPDYRPPNLAGLLRVMHGGAGE